MRDRPFRLLTINPAALPRLLLLFITAAGIMLAAGHQLAAEAIRPSFGAQTSIRILRPPACIPLASPNAPEIALVIDDLGHDLESVRHIAALPRPLTAAFLPYAPRVAQAVAIAREAGQEIFLHMPMEPQSAAIDAGPMVLRVDHSTTRFTPCSRPRWPKCRAASASTTIWLAVLRANWHRWRQCWRGRKATGSSFSIA